MFRVTCRKGRKFNGQTLMYDVSQSTMHRAREKGLVSPERTIGS